MRKLSLVFCCCVCLLAQSVFCVAETGSPYNKSQYQPPSIQIKNGYAYAKPTLFTFLKNGPGDVQQWWRDTFKRENTVGISAMIVGTGLLIAADQWLVDKTQSLGNHMHISQEGDQKVIGKIGIPFSKKYWNLAGPHNIGTGMYFLGDGWLHFGTAGGFLLFGMFQSDNRALQTSSQIVESMITSGFVVQILKHITGRENPCTQSMPRGKWRFFPNQIDYHKHVNKYDAFPSGHLNTAMATLTVIASNYPEYRFIRPVGYSLLTLLSFQMMNNGVHWASDYPLAVFLGYSFAKIAVNRGRTAIGQSGTSTKWELMPVALNDGFGLQIRRRFSL